MADDDKRASPHGLSRAARALFHEKQVEDREREQAAYEVQTDAKIARLREQRLAKEAAEKVAAEAARVASAPKRLRAKP